MSDAIPSALTAKEWADREFYSQYGVSESSASVDHKGRWFFTSMMKLDPESHASVILNESHDPVVSRKLMALANADLLGDNQPFGFTRADIIALRSAAHFLENQRDGTLSTKWPEGANPWVELGPKLRGVADRIAALLPPEA